MNDAESQTARTQYFVANIIKFDTLSDIYREFTLKYTNLTKLAIVSKSATMKNTQFLIGSGTNTVTDENMSL